MITELTDVSKTAVTDGKRKISAAFSDYIVPQ